MKYTKEGVPVIGRPEKESDVDRLVEYLNKHRYGTPEMSRLLDYSGSEIHEYAEFLRRTRPELLETPERSQTVEREEFVRRRTESPRYRFLSQSPPEELRRHEVVHVEGWICLDPRRRYSKSLHNSRERGRGTWAVWEVLRRRGRTLDCFDGHLPRYYRQFGFDEVGRMKFNPEYAPEGWETDPELKSAQTVFMAYRGPYWAGRK